MADDDDPKEFCPALKVEPRPDSILGRAISIEYGLNLTEVHALWLFLRWLDPDGAAEDFAPITLGERRARKEKRERLKKWDRAFELLEKARDSMRDAWHPTSSESYLFAGEGASDDQRRMVGWVKRVAIDGGLAVTTESHRDRLTFQCADEAMAQAATTARMIEQVMELLEEERRHAKATKKWWDDEYRLPFLAVRFHALEEQGVRIADISELVKKSHRTWEPDPLLGSRLVEMDRDKLIAKISQVRALAKKRIPTRHVFTRTRS